MGVPGYGVLPIGQYSQDSVLRALEYRVPEQVDKYFFYPRPISHFPTRAWELGKIGRVPSGGAIWQQRALHESDRGPNRAGLADSQSRASYLPQHAHRADS